MSSLKYLLPFFSYFLGAIPIGWILGRLIFGQDIRKGGSGNIGATNALRQFGSGIGILVLVLDMLKGVLAVILAKYIYFENSPFIVLCGLIAILGHIYPIYLSFKGGKGVATAAGVVLALLPLELLGILGIFVIVVAISRYVSLGSLIAASSLLVMVLFKSFRQEPVNYALIAFTILVVGMIFYKHKENIRRLKAGTENKITFKKKD